MNRLCVFRVERRSGSGPQPRARKGVGRSRGHATGRAHHSAAAAKTSQRREKANSSTTANEIEMCKSTRSRRSEAQILCPASYRVATQQKSPRAVSHRPTAKRCTIELISTPQYTNGPNLSSACSCAQRHCKPSVNEHAQMNSQRLSHALPGWPFQVASSCRSLI